METRLRPQVKVAAAPAFTAAHAGGLQRMCACGGSARMSSDCENGGNKRLRVQRSAMTESKTDSVPPIVHEVLRSPGQPLDSNTRAFMEPRFGHDFSGVRVHTDERAAESAQTINAAAYTVGSDIVFRPGRYEPGSSAGRRLLAHELTHVVQQRSGADASPPGAPPQINFADREPSRTRDNGHHATYMRIGRDAGDSTPGAGPPETVRPGLPSSGTLPTTPARATLQRESVISQPDDPSEREADLVASQVIRMPALPAELRPRVAIATGPALQRDPGPRDELMRQIREKEARLAELQRRAAESQEQFAEATTGAVSQQATRESLTRDRVAAGADFRSAVGGPVPASALSILRRVIRIRHFENTIHFIASFEITFEGIADEEGRRRASVEIPRITGAIREAWTVDLTQPPYRGERFRIDPQISYRALTAPTSRDAWQIKIRAQDDGYPTATLWFTGTMDVNPVHLQGDRIRALGHEIYHLFGFLDEYSPAAQQHGHVVPRSANVGRSDPAGRGDLRGLVDPVVLQNWLRAGAITQADFNRQNQPSVNAWEEDVQIILRALGVQTVAEHRLERYAGAVRRRTSATDSGQWIENVEEIMRLQTEIAELRRQLSSLPAGQQ